MFLSLTLRYFVFRCNETPLDFPLAPYPIREDTTLLSKARQDLTGATRLRNERVGHYWATWALSCLLARRQVNNAVQYMHTATSAHSTDAAWKAAVEAYSASLLPSAAMCELGLNLLAPKSSCRTLSELYTLRKLEYHHTGCPYTRRLCIEWDFEARWKELFSPVKLDDPIATTLPKALCLMGQIHPLQRGLPEVNQLLHPVDNHGPRGCQPRGRGKLDFTPHVLGQPRSLGPPLRGPWVLSIANCDDKAMDTLGRMWKSNWEVFVSRTGFCSF